MNIILNPFVFNIFFFFKYSVYKINEHFENSIDLSNKILVYYYYGFLFLLHTFKAFVIVTYTV